MTDSAIRADMLKRAAADDLYNALEDVYAFASKTSNGLTWRFVDQPCAKRAVIALAKARGEVA